MITKYATDSRKIQYFPTGSNCARDLIFQVFSGLKLQCMRYRLSFPVFARLKEQTARRRQKTKKMYNFLEAILLQIEYFLSLFFASMTDYGGSVVIFFGMSCGVLLGWLIRGRFGRVVTKTTMNGQVLNHQLSILKWVLNEVLLIQSFYRVFWRLPDSKPVGYHDIVMQTTANLLLLQMKLVVIITY